jgi:predicted Fe-S protein YdhL (DUF1289 family)
MADIKMNSERSPALSPCISKCTLDDKNICTGCFRYINEIRLWGQVDENTRHQFLSNSKNRKSDYNAAE